MADHIIDQRIRMYFNQALTQAEIALCLSVREGTQICHFRRRLAQLQLHRHQLSDPAEIINSKIRGQAKASGWKLFVAGWNQDEHIIT